MHKSITHKHLKKALTIRAVENKFLDLFSEGKLNGTVHTCVGQEFSALAFAGQLQKKDFVFSNHRCHGHYIAFTNDVHGLLAELLGKKSGTSGGIGSSQHLCKNNFFSNGIQGGIVPVAAGYALGNKLKNNGAIGLVYIGDGTLGEGVLYETMNILSKWDIPLIIVCENNFYAQSTPQSVNLAGDILARAKAFDIKTMYGNTEKPELLMDDALNAIDYVRLNSKPLFFQVDTYRLNPHSKGDDDRHADEIYTFRQKDYLEMFSKNEEAYYNKYQDSIVQQVNEMVEEILLEPETDLTDYYKPTALKLNLDWNTIEPIAKRQVELINDFFRKEISANDKLVFIGEDVLSPYGGAFKVARDLSDIAPERVFSTPISEAAIMGISNGLALNGFKPFAEIMFGDFITLAFDQIVNHASKFHHMFNKQVNCPVVVRTPMGGRRGYGPTHSQTLDKFLVGIDNVKTIALNTFIDPTEIFKSIVQEEHPVILIENKIDYGKKILNHPAQNYKYQKNSDSYPVVRVSPTVSLPSLTIVAYGGMADIINTFLINIFIETNLLVELIIPTLISDLPIELISKSVEQTGKLVVIEEGSAYAGIGSELIAGLNELGVNFKGKRIAALPVPIPSAKSLEHAVLPGLERIIEEIKKTYGSSANN